MEELFTVRTILSSSSHTRSEKTVRKKEHLRKKILAEKKAVLPAVYLNIHKLPDAHLYQIPVDSEFKRAWRFQFSITIFCFCKAEMGQWQTQSLIRI